VDKEYSSFSIRRSRSRKRINAPSRKITEDSRPYFSKCIKNRCKFFL